MRLCTRARVYVCVCCVSRTPSARSGGPRRPTKNASRGFRRKPPDSVGGQWTLKIVADTGMATDESVLEYSRRGPSTRILTYEEAPISCGGGDGEDGGSLRTTTAARARLPAPAFPVCSEPLTHGGALVALDTSNVPWGDEPRASTHRRATCSVPPTPPYASQIDCFFMAAPDRIGVGRGLPRRLPHWGVGFLSHVPFVRRRGLQTRRGAR